jgi:D-alanyl-D-alanine dipeptidase
MGTPYDSFSSLAEPQYEEKFLKEGKLTQKQVENRLVLRRVMTGAGFKNIPNEWWHFDGLPQKELEAKYHMVE